MPTKHFKCCMEKAFAPLDMSNIDGDELLTAVLPCKKYYPNQTSILNDTHNLSFLSGVFDFYLKNDVADKDKICTEHYCEQPTKTSHKIYIAVLSLLLLVIVAGNASVILAATKARKFRKNVTSLFVISLAFGDLFASCINIPILVTFASHNGYFCKSVYVCKLSTMAETICFAASFIQLLIISIDRYVAVLYPYVYRRQFTTNRARKAIFVVWLNAILWGVFKDFDFERLKFGAVQIIHLRCIQTSDYHTQIFTCVLFFVPVVIMSVLYTRIWLIAVAQAKELDHQKVHIKSTNQQNTTINNHQKLGFFHKRKLELRATRVILTILGTYIICWLPNLMMSFVNTFEKVKDNMTIYMLLYQIPPSFSSAINPFIYCILHKDFRNSFKFTVERFRAGLEHRLSMRQREKKRKVGKVTETTMNSINSECYM